MLSQPIPARSLIEQLTSPYQDVKATIEKQRDLKRGYRETALKDFNDPFNLSRIEQEELKQRIEEMERKDTTLITLKKLPAQSPSEIELEISKRVMFAMGFPGVDPRDLRLDQMRKIKPAIDEKMKLVSEPTPLTVKQIEIPVEHFDGLESTENKEGVYLPANQLL